VSDADVTKALHDDAAAVPVDGEGKWIDSGRWREVGVVHWHLIEPREWPVNDSARFSTERAEAERGRASAGVAGSPHEVTTWMTEVTDKLIAENHLDEQSLRSSGLGTPADRRSREETRFRMAMVGMDVCSMLALRPGRIAHFSAYSVTYCTAPH
jgi:hypothetical protein